LNWDNMKNNWTSGDDDQKFISHPPVFISKLSPSLLNMQSEILNKPTEGNKENMQTDNSGNWTVQREQLLKADQSSFELFKKINSQSEKVIVVLGNWERTVKHNQMLIFREITQRNESVLYTCFEILELLSMTWDEYTDTWFQSSIHKLQVSSENGLQIDSRLIGYSEVHKNLMFLELTQSGALEGLFRKIGVTKKFNRVIQVLVNINI